MSLAHSVNSTVKQSRSRVAVVLALQLFFASAQIVFPRFDTTLLVDALQEVRRVLGSDRPRRRALRAGGTRPRRARRQRGATRAPEDEPSDRPNVGDDDHDQQPDQFREVPDELGLARYDVEDAEDPKEEQRDAEHALAEDHAETISPEGRASNAAGSSSLVVPTFPGEPHGRTRPPAPRTGDRSPSHR